MPFPHLILLNGPKGSGKTTVAGELCKHIPYSLALSTIGYLQDALALLAFDQADIMNGINWDDQSFKTRELPFAPGVSVRQALIDLGNLVRKWNPGFLSSRLAAQLPDIYKSGIRTVIVSNVRTKEDCLALPLDEAVLVRIYRDEADWTDDLGYHVLLTDVVQIDIDNNGPLESTISFLMEHLNALA